LTAILIVITMVDFDCQLIPDEFISALAVAGILYLLAVQLPQLGVKALLSSVIGFAVGGGLFLLVSAASKGGMGGGDIKLMAVLGLWFGWEKLLLLMLLSFVGGALVSIPLLVLKRKGRKDGIPFGPFIAFAAYLTSLYGMELIQWYLQRLV
jgi:leader peptidase (prepilin peptidase)/N-methyltransferase